MGTDGPPKIRVQHEGNSTGCEKGETSHPVLQIETRLISIERNRFRQVRDSQHNKCKCGSHISQVSSHKKATKFGVRRVNSLFSFNEFLIVK